jgi:hypothetical protein
VTVVAAAIETTHVPVPVQPPPLHPAKTEPPDAVAVSVTLVPKPYACEQSRPQSMPVGADLTVPVPAPAFAIASVNCWSVNGAVTVTSSSTVTTHGPVPMQPPPDQPLNVEPVAGVAVSVTAVPGS